MSKYLWCAYRTDTNNNPFGRDFVGYIGWHEIGDANSAMVEAHKRYPDVPMDVMQVSIA